MIEETLEESKSGREKKLYLLSKGGALFRSPIFGRRRWALKDTSSVGICVIGSVPLSSPCLCFFGDEMYLNRDLSVKFHIPATHQR